MNNSIKFDVVKKYAFVNGESTAIDIDGSVIEVKKNISLQEAISFVANVVQICFAENGEYMPELRDFGIRLNVIARYTNIELDDNTGNVYDVLYGNDLFETILNEVDDGQFKSIVYGIDQRIKLINDMNAVSFNKNMVVLQGQIEKFFERFENLFSGISKEDFAMIAKAVGDDSISVEELVRDRLTERKKEDGT